ncbi:MAG: serine/threonine-protein phosphatase, partial [Nitrospirae bacterium]|nr:serine/threonine-protein phosphatase [Nitrospirota bacterium]
MSNWSLDYGNEQHIGSRKEQQDYFASFPPDMEVVMSDRGFLVVVADGMGGHSDGAKASVLAVNVFLEEYKAAITRLPVIEALKHSLHKSNKSICDANIKTGYQSDMGSTLVACVLHHDLLYWISIGDSRIYVARDGALQRVNEEHSLRAEMEKKKNLAHAPVDDVPLDSKTKHMLTSYLGIENIKKLDYSKAPLEMKPGDRVLLCTDGLFKALSEKEILECLNMAAPAQKKCEIIIERIARKKIPNQDNTTIVLFCLNEKL